MVFIPRNECNEEKEKNAKKRPRRVEVVNIRE